MQAQSTAAKNSLTTINALTPVYKNAVSAHKVAFLSIDKLFTRIGNALKVSDTTVQVDESAQTIIRKYKVAEQTLKRQKNRKNLQAKQAMKHTTLLLKVCKDALLLRLYYF